MLYSTYCGQDDKTINEVQEIYFSRQNFDLLLEYSNTYPDKKFVYEIVEDIPSSHWKILSQIPNVIVELTNMYLSTIAKEYNIPFFYKYPISSYYELNSLAEMGVCYIRLAPPLFFDIPKVSLYNIPIRICPNKAYDPIFPNSDPITGTWIRPEDLHLYEPYNVIVEFDTTLFPTEDKLLTERTLLSIYKSGTWGGSISKIIPQLTTPVRNPLVFEGLGEKRLSCRHTCQQKICHYCPNAIKFGYVIQERNKDGFSSLHN